MSFHALAFSGMPRMAQALTFVETYVCPSCIKNARCGLSKPISSFLHSEGNIPQLLDGAVEQVEAIALF